MPEKHVILRSLTGIALAALCACSHQATVPDKYLYQESAPKPEISLCDLKALSQKSAGIRKTIRATYSSDATRYEYFKDPSCKNDGLIAVSYTAGSGDETVRQFYQDWRNRCKARALNYCAQTATVTADVAVVIEASGVATLSILRVWNVAFVK